VAVAREGGGTASRGARRGCSPPPKVVYRLVREKRLAAVRVSNAIRISADEIQRFVSRGPATFP